MYSYLVSGVNHTNFSPEYMSDLGLDAEQIESILRQRDFDSDAAISAVKTECTRRIESKWNAVGQLNAALGIYGEALRNECVTWVQANITACNELLARTDILDINWRSDTWWPE